MLEINHITKHYGKKTALSDVSFSVANGKICGLLGPNGAGKTTLIRIINHIIMPDEGEVLLDGKAITEGDLRDIGYLPEERGLYPKMEIAEQAIYLARLKGLTRQEAVKRLKYWFDKFDIMPWWHKKVEELSKGMAQKVQFITTILHDPHLIILDEPLSGLDPVNASLIIKEIRNLQQEDRVVLLSTHDMNSVEELCDKCVLINQSHLVLDGDYADIMANHVTSSFTLTTPDELPKDFNKYVAAGQEPERVDGMNRYTMQKLPTMNEIFIQAVTQKQTTNTNTTNNE